MPNHFYAGPPNIRFHFSVRYFLSLNCGVNEILISQILSFVILFLKSSHTLATYSNSLTISFLPTELDYTSYFSQIPLHWFCYYNHNHTSYTSHLIQILSFIHFGTKKNYSIICPSISLPNSYHSFEEFSTR